LENELNISDSACDLLPTGDNVSQVCWMESSIQSTVSEDSYLQCSWNISPEDRWVSVD